MPPISARCVEAEVKDTPIDRAEDGIEPGRRLIRVETDGGQTLTDWVAQKLHRLAWRTPLHSLQVARPLPPAAARCAQPIR